MFPETRHAWRRLKLVIAEILVLSMQKGDHSLGYLDRVQAAAEAIAEFREMYYRAPQRRSEITEQV